MIGTPPACGTFDVPRSTQAANTVIQRIIPPFTGNSGGSPKRFTVSPVTGTNSTTSKPNWWGPEDAFTHVTDIVYTSLTTSHSLFVMRPLNFTWVTAAVASNTTAVTVAFDPGAWSVAGNYQYQLPINQAAPCIASNVAATNDYVSYQLLDGTWVIDKITVSGLVWTMTTGTPNVAGAGIAAGSPIFWYGIQSDTDPSTGMIHPLFDSNTNTTSEKFQSQGTMGLWRSLHKGDPLIIQSSNGTNAGVLEYAAGYYSNLY